MSRVERFVFLYRKTKINEVVALESRRNILWVGIAEVDFDWSPFPSGYRSMEDCDVRNETCDRVNSVENDYPNPEGDEDGISKTVNSMKRVHTDGRLLDDEWEEGEIRNDDDIGAEKAAVLEMESMEREPLPETSTQVVETPVIEARSLGEYPNHGELQLSPMIECQWVDGNYDPHVDHPTDGTDLDASKEKN